MVAAPSSRPLVSLIHGYLDDPTAWRHIPPALKNEGFRTLAPALARRETALTLDAFAETVTSATHAALAAEDRDGVVLVGQSMGAQVAELAARSIGDVRALALLTPTPWAAWRSLTRWPLLSGLRRQRRDPACVAQPPLGLPLC